MVEISKFTLGWIDDYEESLKAYRDWKNTIDTAEMKGLEKGMQQGLEMGRAEGEFLAKKKLASLMKENGGTEEQICQLTGWNLDELRTFLD